MPDETEKLVAENSELNIDSDCRFPDTDAAHSETVVTTTTKNALISSPEGSCESYPHKLKVSIIGAGNVGMACAIAILMRRIASEICLVDKNKEKVEAEAEDIRHTSIFLGNPLVIGSEDISKIKKSAVVIIAVGDPAPDEEPNLQKNLQIFKIIIPGVAKWCPRAVILVATQPTDVMSYIAWKFSKFPDHRVLGIGTLIDSVRFQYYLGQKLGLANTSISCMNIGAQGSNSSLRPQVQCNLMPGNTWTALRWHIEEPGAELDYVYDRKLMTWLCEIYYIPVWSSVNVAGMKLRDINPKMGEEDDPEKWSKIGTMVNECGNTLNQQKGSKGPNCWGLGFCAAEIVDAILRDTRVVLPVSTHIKSCSHGTDKDIFMSVPCIIGKGGVLGTSRQKLTDSEKRAVQVCADGIRAAIRESGILRKDDLEVEVEVEQEE